MNAKHEFSESNFLKKQKRLVNGNLYEILKVLYLLYSSLAQSVEHAAVNRSVVGSSPTGGVFYYADIFLCYIFMAPWSSG